MDRNPLSGRGRDRRDGISESVGFILILAAVIIALSIYLLYLMPAMGRETEISQMGSVKESLTEFKLNIDTLWTSRQCTTEFGPALSLGSGETGGIMGFFPFLSPVKAGAVLALNQRKENITISSDSYTLTGSGGYTESRAMTTTPVNLVVNTTPSHLFVNISTASLLLERGVLISGPGWDVWVNVSPKYSYTRRFNMTVDPTTGGLASAGFWERDEFLWNSTDVNVNTYSGSTPIVDNLAVYRGISTSGVYPVDLMNPVYGISTRFQNPQSLWVSKSDNTVAGTVTVCYGYSPTVTSTTWPLGSIEYRSNNIYYTPQTYYYQLGGVFLEQDDGSTMEIPPSISLSMANTSPVVKVGEILLQGSVSDADMSGSGPITVTSAVTDIKNSPLATGNNTKWVNITIQSSSVNASAMWLRTLRDIADRGGLPVTAYTNGSAGNVAFINVTGSPQVYDVQLALTQVNVSADYLMEYSPGGISRSWRSVPGYAMPTTYAGGLNSTTTSLYASTTTPNYGSSVTFTAVVAGSGGPGTPTGTVTFVNGSVTLGTVALSSGSAVLATSTLPVGVNSVTATYNGDSYYSTSTSNTVQVTVSVYTPPAGYTAWYDCSWTHRKNITIDKTKVNGAQTDFPVLINLTSDNELKTYARSNGFDILFTDSSGTQKIPHQIEYYSAGTGGLIAWVKVASISSAANTTIYMYYGKPGSPNQENVASVWSNGYAAVWHLNESGSGVANEFRDSSGNGNHGQGGGGTPSMVPARSAGKIGYGQTLTSASGMYIPVPDSATLQISGAITVEGWGNFNSGGISDNQTIIGRQYGTLARDSYQLGHFITGTLQQRVAGYVTTNGGVVGGNPASSAWVHYAMNLTGAGGTLYIFQNGATVANVAGQTITTDANPVLIGAEENTAGGWGMFWDGGLDELRISNVARDGTWMLTEYNNQNSPSTFYWVGPQESSSCAPAFVQTKTTGIRSFLNSESVTLDRPLTAGNLLVVSVVLQPQSTTISSITDTRGNSYNLAIGPTTAGGWGQIYTYYASNVAGGSDTITVNFAGGAPSYDISFVTEYSGIATTAPLDQTSGDHGTSGSMNSGSKVTSQAVELIYGFAASDNGPITADPPYVTRGNVDGQEVIADQSVVVDLWYSFTGSAPVSNWACQMATFKGK